MRTAFVYAFAIVVLAGCGGREEPGADAGHTDAQTGIDAQVEIDAGDDEDAGRDDAGGELTDAHVDPDIDGGELVDSGVLPDAARVCMIGQVCGDSQPCADGASFRCYGFGESGFCAPFAPECGGFANIRCTDGRTCIRGGGGSLGYCATAEELECICTSSAENDIPTDGCPDRFFPDGGPVDGGEPPRE